MGDTGTLSWSGGSARVLDTTFALPAPDGATPAAVLFGLYDPLTGERILTVDGADYVRLELE